MDYSIYALLESVNLALKANTLCCFARLLILIQNEDMGLFCKTKMILNNAVTAVFCY